MTRARISPRCKRQKAAIEIPAAADCAGDGTEAVSKTTTYERGLTMKKLLMGAVALASIQAAPAMAQQASLDVTGTVASKCSTFSLSNIAFSAISTNNATGVATGGDVTTSTASAAVWCNKAGASVSYSHTPMLAQNVTAPSAAFTNTVDFTPTVKLGLQTIAGAGTTVDVVAANLTVNATTNPTTAIPVADSYLGTITVTLTPGA